MNPPPTSPQPGSATSGSTPCGEPDSCVTLVEGPPSLSLRCDTYKTGKCAPRDGARGALALRFVPSRRPETVLLLRTGKSRQDRSRSAQAISVLPRASRHSWVSPPHSHHLCLPLFFHVSVNRTPRRCRPYSAPLTAVSPCWRRLEISCPFQKLLPPWREGYPSPSATPLVPLGHYIGFFSQVLLS